MKINKEIAEQIIYDDHEDYKMIEQEIVDQRRWVTVYEGIFKNNKTGKFYQTSYEKGSTECQDSEPFYSDEVDFQEVELKEVIVKKWMPVIEKEI